MKKIIIILSLLIVSLVAFSNGYITSEGTQVSSNDTVNLTAKVKIFVKQWMNLSLVPVESITFTNYGQWDGSDQNGELLGTFGIQSNGPVNMTVAVDENLTTPVIYSALTGLNIIDKAENNVVSGNKEITIGKETNDVKNEIFFDIRGKFNIAENTLSTDDVNNYLLFYNVEFKPMTKFQ